MGDTNEKEQTPLYVCENCGRLAPITLFRDECQPGWTHGRLIAVKSMEIAWDWSRLQPELLALWIRADEEEDDDLAAEVKRALTCLKLPWVPMVS